MNKVYSYKRISAILLIMIFLTVIAPVDLYGADYTGVLDDVVDYYKSDKSGLDSWWELVALYGAGQDLNDGSWTLPQWGSEDLPAATANPADYSGFILGLMAMDENPQNALGGRNLTEELADKQKVDGTFGSSAINMHIWSMVALDAAEEVYDRDNAVEWLLNNQKTDGGFALSGINGDPDMTGMALIALSPYKNQADVSSAVYQAVEYLDKTRCESGGYSSWGTENSNSAATVISGLVSVSQEVSSSIIDALLQYRLTDNTFSYQKGGSTNYLSTAQSLIALGDVVEDNSVFHRLSIPKQPPVEKKVGIRVEGSSNSIVNKEITVTSAVYAADALKQVLDSENISYDIQDGTWGQYINSIDGETAGKFGGYDGWLYLVNGDMASVGVGEYKIEDGDELVFYYGMYPPDTLIPQVIIQPENPKVGDSLTITVTSSYYDWNTGNTVELKVQNADINFNSKTYTTDVNGQAIVSSPDDKGTYTLKVSKDNEGSYPGIVRIPGISVIYKANDNSGEGSGSGGSGSGGTGSGGTGSGGTSKTATLSVEGDSLKGMILPTVQVLLRDGDTAYSILARKMGSKVKSKGFGSNIYVYEIDGLAEFDRGPSSGWMFEVNGENPDVSASAYVLKDKDVVKWYYSSDSDEGLGVTNQTGTAKSGNNSKEISSTVNNEIKKTLSENIQGTTDKILAQGEISDWSVFALLRAGRSIPEKYISSLKTYIKEHAADSKSATDVARMVLTANAAGINPANIDGNNLIEKLFSMEKIDRQGVTGPVFALIALDSGPYNISSSARWTRDKLVSLILEYQNEDGGFCLAKGEKSDIDLTAMALQSLSGYISSENVASSVEKAINWLSNLKPEEEQTSESISQIIIALTSLGKDPESIQFVMYDGDLLSCLLKYKKEDGEFLHTLDGGSDEMATEQALMAIASYSMYVNGSGRLYSLQDPNGAYSDLHAISQWAYPYIAKASEQGLMEGIKTGASGQKFDPKRNISRAELTALLLRILGEEPSKSFTSVYNDITEDSWYFGYVLKARENGIVNGVSENTFDPDKPVTRQEMAVMTARGFALDNKAAGSRIYDLDIASEWARQAIESVYNNGIMMGDNNMFNPKGYVSREMAAAIAVRLYDRAQE